MKKLRFLLWIQLLVLPLIVFSSFSGCEKEEDIIVDVPELNDSIPSDLPEIKDSVQMPHPEVNPTLSPTYVIDIHTGDAEVNEKTAKCHITGYLQAEANGGEFNFDYGICLSTNSVPTVEDEIQKHTVMSGVINNIDVDLSLPYTFSDLKPNTTYYYRAYFKNNLDGRIEYADEINSFKTPYILCPDDNHPHVIDLGLPSGTKWACCNVGALCPEDYGDHYAWGETEEKSEYTFESYEYFDTNIGYITIGPEISKTQYDAAFVKWGDSWHMPTPSEFEELLDNCIWSDITYKGITGRIFTGHNGYSIFLPMSMGTRVGRSPDYAWSTAVREMEGENKIKYTCSCSFSTDPVILDTRAWSIIGNFWKNHFVVRPVTDKLLSDKK